MLHASNTYFEMNSGMISGNSSVRGQTNNNMPAVYIHTDGTFVMNDGIISNNTGYRCGGVFVRSEASSVTINGGSVINNNNLSNDKEYAYAHDLYVAPAKNDDVVLKESTYTQNVESWIDEGYCISKVKADGTYFVTIHDKKETGYYQDGYTAPTCSQKGVSDATKCSNCDGVVKEGDPIETVDHSFSGDWFCCEEPDQELGHYQLCIYNCGTKSAIEGHSMTEWTPKQSKSLVNMESRCTKCGYISMLAVHEHELGNYRYDQTGHWQLCEADDICDETAGTKFSEASHEFGDWTTTRYPTTTQKGEETQSCKVCGYQQTRVIPELVIPHIHQLGSYHYEQFSHWQLCEADDICDETAGTKFSEASHEFGDWTTTRFPTTTQKGEKTRACKACGYQQSQEIPVYPPPVTGDDSQPVLWVCAMLLSLTGLVAALVTKKRLN